MKDHFKELGLNLFLSSSLDKIRADQNLSPHFNHPTFSAYKNLVLIGSGGSYFYDHFTKKFGDSLNKATHPFDTYSIKCIRDVDPDALILYPNHEYLPPLQKLGRFFHLSHPSPLGIDISNEFGLWFSYRGLFLTNQDVLEYRFEKKSSPCESCESLDCVKACPALAVSSKLDFKLNDCFTYRLSAHSTCESNCLSRLACPYKKEWQYSLSQINYHMKM